MGDVTYPKARVVFTALPWDSDEPISLEAIPKSFMLKRNTLRQADTFTVTLDYRKYPFDPRAFKDVLVAIYFHDTKAAHRQLKLTTKNEQFIGYADSVTTKLDNGEEMVTIEGRDYTSIFLDRPWDHTTMLDITGTLDQVIKRFLKRVPGAEDIQVTYSERLALAEPSKGSMRPVITSKKGNVSTVEMVKVLNRTKWTTKGKDDDCWTALNDLLDLVGVLPVINKDELNIRDPKHFGTHSIELQYGKNLTSLEFLKKSNSARKQRIRVVAFDAEVGEKTEAEYPLGTITERKVKRRSSTNTGIGSGNSNLTTNKLKAHGTSTNMTPRTRVVTTDVPVITFNYHGSYSKDELFDIAKNIYEQGARKQVEVRMKTKAFTDGTASLLNVAHGDLVDVVLGSRRVSSAMTKDDRHPLTALTEGLGAMDDLTARDFLASISSVQGMLTSFRVKASTLEWNRDTGMSIDITAINYVA